MTPPPPSPDRYQDADHEPISEPLLLDAVRNGSMGAFGILYARNRDHALVVARSTLTSAEAAFVEDVVEAAFLRILSALRNGRGPRDSLRYYLGTAVRREAWEWQRQARRQAQVRDRWSADETADRREQAGSKLVPSGAGLDAHALLATAFAGLSDSWRQVLWLSEVEGRRPAELAPLLGLSPGSSAALAYRARQGLLRAYFQAYRDVLDDEACRALVRRLQGYVAAGQPPEGYTDVVDHLAGCGACRDVVRGVDVAAELGAAAPLGVLGFGRWARAAAAGGAPEAMPRPGRARLVGAIAVAAAAAVAAVAVSSGVGARVARPVDDRPLAISATHELVDGEAVGPRSSFHPAPSPPQQRGRLYLEPPGAAGGADHAAFAR